MIHSTWTCRSAKCDRTYESPLAGVASVRHKGPFGKMHHMRRTWSSKYDKVALNERKERNG